MFCVCVYVLFFCHDTSFKSFRTMARGDKHILFFCFCFGETEHALIFFSFQPLVFFFWFSSVFVFNTCPSSPSPFVWDLQVVLDYVTDSKPSRHTKREAAVGGGFFSFLFAEEKIIALMRCRGDQQAAGVLNLRLLQNVAFLHIQALRWHGKRVSTRSDEMALHYSISSRFNEADSPDG